jgi:hypothetical protein
VSSPIPPVVPAPIDPSGSSRGWVKKALIGCGVFALVVAACLLGVILYLRQRPEALTDVVMKQVESHYASDVTAQEKEDLREAYADFRVALKEHRVSREPLDRMRTTLTVSSQNEITREQVRDLTALFRQAAGPRTGPGAPAAPIPSLRPSP